MQSSPGREAPSRIHFGGRVIVAWGLKSVFVLLVIVLRLVSRMSRRIDEEPVHEPLEGGAQGGAGAPLNVDPWFPAHVVFHIQTSIPFSSGCLTGWLNRLNIKFNGHQNVHLAMHLWVFTRAKA